jgi:hypothetical protein
MLDRPSSTTLSLSSAREHLRPLSRTHPTTEEVPAASRCAALRRALWTGLARFENFKNRDTIRAVLPVLGRLAENFGTRRKRSKDIDLRSR